MTTVTPEGPVGAARTDCPAVIPATSCSKDQFYDCQPESETGCIACECKPKF